MSDTPSGIRFSPRPNRAHEIQWRPWGGDAFRHAQQTGKPVLLSISAVWCHWCHVMDETAYSDPEVIRLINDRYIPVRIDRDLRPDIDARYNMGGWPTAAFISAEGDLLTGCTYTPPQEFAILLQQLADAYQHDKDGIRQRASLLQAKATPPSVPHQALDLALVQQIVDTAKRSFDPIHGGFNDAPKFAHADSLALLLHWSRATEDPACRAMVLQSLDAMMNSELRDHSEGGFYRYATGADWSVPHYEKILLDNLKLTDLYIEAYLATSDPRYANIASEVLDYAGTNLFDASQGLFYGSQDADEDYYPLSLEDRQSKEKPPRDATFYTDMNALACSVHLKASWALGRLTAKETALEALESLLALEWAHGLRHSYDPDGSAGIPALLQDHACLLRALLDAHEHAGSDRYLNEARRVANHMISRFNSGDESAPLFDTPYDSEAMAALRHRLVPVDGNALASGALDQLARATYDPDHHHLSGRLLSSLSVDPNHHTDTAAAYAMSIYRWLHPAVEVTVEGVWGSDATRRMMFSAASLPYPNVAIRQVHVADGDPEMAWAEACLDTMCLAPVKDPAQLRPVVMDYLGASAPDAPDDLPLDDLPIVTLLSPPV